MKPVIGKSKWVLLTLLPFLCFWFLRAQKPTAESPVRSHFKSATASDSAAARSKKTRSSRRYLSPEEARAQGLPQGVFEYVFDKAPNTNRFLLSKGRDDKFVPDADAAPGMDLWLQDESGKDHLVNPSVQRARFSPNGRKIAYSTSDSVLHIEDLQGGKLAEVQGAQGPIWRSNGSVVVFSKVPDGQDVRQLPATSHPASLDLVTGKVDLLTDGNFDDAPGEFSSSLEQ